MADSIHGDIRLTDRERRVVDTASFQRLRQLKQLGMAQLTYPNATHTRFAHSLGTLCIMRRILILVRQRGIPIDDGECDNLCLAALLHDVGHYPYSHLMEGIDNVQLLEDFAGIEVRSRSLDASASPYPKHAAVGRLIVEGQEDLIEAIGGDQRAQAVADLFTRSNTAN